MAVGGGQNAEHSGLGVPFQVLHITLKTNINDYLRGPKGPHWRTESSIYLYFHAVQLTYLRVPEDRSYGQILVKAISMKFQIN